MQDVMMHLRCNEFHELASAGKKSLAISFVKFVKINNNAQPKFVKFV